MTFSIDEIDRYGRQIVLPNWGAAGQERVRAATVVLRGMGPAAELAGRYLAGAGVGELHLDVGVAEARALNPLVLVHAITPHSPEVPVDPDPSPAEDPEHPDQPAPDVPGPPGFEEPSPEKPAIARIHFDGRPNSGINRSTAITIATDEDRAASGSALAVETLKAILGLPHHTLVSLKSIASLEPIAGAPAR